MKPSARWLFALILTLAGALAPGVLHAQGPLAESLEWREERTGYFVVLYPRGEEAEATRYTAFADQVYDDLAALFDHRLEPPITLRLYPTLVAYEEINPLAAEVEGVVAHAQLSRREIAVLTPRTVNLTDEEIVNNVRHELTHLIVADLSGNRLPTGFHEGIAQYVERPGRDHAVKIELLQAAYQGGQLLSWTELNAGTVAYQNPQVGYPQSLSIVAYLVDEYGFPRFVEFLRALEEATGYRSALETTYGVAADRLEQAWLDALPAYLGGRWQVNALWAYDLGPIRTLVEEGAYAAAESQIEEVISLLEESRQEDVLAEARRLLAVSRRGQEAGPVVLAAREALGRHEYAVALGQVAVARDIYAEIGDRRHDRELSELRQWAEDGLAALERLAAAEAATGVYEMDEASRLAREAGAALSALGNEAAAARSQAVVNAVEFRRRVGAFGLLSAGLLGILGNLLLRWRDYRVRAAAWAGSA